MIDVVMPCWILNEELLALTEAAVGSLKPQGRLIIIDNGSPIGGGKLRELSDVYVRNKENLGYAKAVNQGLKLSGQIVAVANNDIRVSPNWAEAVDILEACVKGASNNWGSIHFKMIGYQEPFPGGGGSWMAGKERWCSGSFFVMRNKWLFDEGFLNSYEDWDLQVRIRKDGYATCYTNIACYQHQDSTTQQFIEERSDNDARNREYFKKKHGEYPEDMYWKLFPDQMPQPWKPFP